ncbi:hypothetical protein DPMN_142022 [Dreissena polymorpha]|uniref:Uncharacterized protein n=1 Tax=Dreissena polymorpha TaxID=45954 RepID=A0A9D4JI92_DREPO|nr:hypothetical protein DPMN_142022 [Dreissena polymorpha]
MASIWTIGNRACILANYCDYVRQGVEINYLTLLANNCGQRRPGEENFGAKYCDQRRQALRPYCENRQPGEEINDHTFHDDWAKNVTSRVHVIQLTGTIFELNSHIKETNVLTKFHENWAKNVTFRVFTCFHYIHIETNAPPTGGHVFSPIWTIFELVRDINKTNVLTNFHDDWAKIVTSIVFTRKTAPPPGSHETNVLTKFHEIWAKNLTFRVEKCPAHWWPCFFSPIWTIFKLVRDINKTNVLTNFHDDWAKSVTSRVFTRKTAPPTGGHVFQRSRTTFELN